MALLDEYDSYLQLDLCLVSSRYKGPGNHAAYVRIATQFRVFVESVINSGDEAHISWASARLAKLLDRIALNQHPVRRRRLGPAKPFYPGGLFTNEVARLTIKQCNELGIKATSNDIARLCSHGSFRLCAICGSEIVLLRGESYLFINHSVRTERWRMKGLKIADIPLIDLRPHECRARKSWRRRLVRLLDDAKRGVMTAGAL